MNTDKIKNYGIAVDIDETLSNTLYHLVERILNKFGNPENLTVSQLIKKYRYTYNVPYWQNEKVFNWIQKTVSVNKLQEELPLIKNSNLYVNKINKIIPINAYITVRPEKVLRGTRNWLNANNFPKAKIICRPLSVARKDGDEWKAKILKELYPEIIGLIDDNPSILKFLGKKYKGIVFLYNNIDNLNFSNAIACKNWNSVYKETKNYFKK